MGGPAQLSPFAASIIPEALHLQDAQPIIKDDSRRGAGAHRMASSADSLGCRTMKEAYEASSGGVSDHQMHQDRL